MDFTQFFASMSLSKSDASPKDSLSRACPAACGALITAKDPHPFCEVCLGLKHAEEALENPDNCSHCFMLPNKLQRCHLKVAVTHCIDLSLSESDGERVTTHYWGPPGAQRLSTGLTSPILHSPKRISLQTTSRSLTNQAISPFGVPQAQH